MTGPDQPRRLVAPRLGNGDALVPLSLGAGPVDRNGGGEAAHFSSPRFLGEGDQRSWWRGPSAWRKEPLHRTSCGPPPPQMRGRKLITPAAAGRRLRSALSSAAEAGGGGPAAVPGPHANPPAVGP